MVDVLELARSMGINIVIGDEGARTYSSDSSDYSDCEVTREILEAYAKASEKQKRLIRYLILLDRRDCSEFCVNVITLDLSDHRSSAPSSRPSKKMAS